MKKIIADGTNTNLVLEKKSKLRFKSITSSEGLEMSGVLRSFIDAFSENPQKYIKDLNLK